MKKFLQSVVSQWHQHACHWVRCNFHVQKQPQSRMCLLLKHHQYSGDRAHRLLSCLSVTLAKALHIMSTVQKETVPARFHFVVSPDSVIAHELHLFSNYNAENLHVCDDSNIVKGM